MDKNVALLILRLSGLGLAFAHGWAKISALSTGGGDYFINAVGGLGFPLPAVFAWAAALAEFVGGFAIAFGLLTRIAAAFAAVTMFVAAFVRHRLAHQVLGWLGGINLPEEVVEGWGNPERAAVYLLIFIAIVLLGAGRFSLDWALRRKS